MRGGDFKFKRTAFGFEMEICYHTHKTMAITGPLIKVIFEKPFKVDAVKFVFVWLARCGLISNGGRKWATHDYITVDQEYTGAVVFPQIASPRSSTFMLVVD